MAKFDFAPISPGLKDSVYTGAIWRRYCATWIDLVIIGIYVFTVLIPNPEDPDATTSRHIPFQFIGLLNFALLLGVMYFPEAHFRRSLGMWIMGLVVIPPPERNPQASILIRKVLNLFEFILPSPVYYWVVALNKENASLSDQVSGCIVARTSYLRRQEPAPEQPPIWRRCALALIATIGPLGLFFGSMFLLFAILPHILQDIVDLFNASNPVSETSTPAAENP